MNNVELLITNIGYAVSFFVALGLGILVISRGVTKQANVMFFFMTICIAIWQASYAIGINLVDPESSRIAFMFNMVTMLLAVVTAHLVLVLSNRFEKQKKVIIAFYVVAFALCIFYIIFPQTFLLPSKQVLYLPNFFVPGPLYSIGDTFFFIAFLYLLYSLYKGYHHADFVLKNRLKYVIVAVIYGYTISLIPEFLLYGIMVDPLLSCLTGFYTVPFAYAIIKYDAINLNILAKRAVGYALSVGGVTLFILLTGYINDAIAVFYPNFPIWIIPFGSGLIAVAVGVLAWRKIKEVDLLKYEFVDVVTHKFRTPLTHIRWSVELLKGAEKPEEREEAIRQISDANVRLFELTDTLIGLSASDNSMFMYQYQAEHASDLIDSVIKAESERATKKHIAINSEVSTELPQVYVDRKRIEFALQMVLDNAVTYSPVGSIIQISARLEKTFLTVSVRDYGIGIAPEDMTRLFSKFYRGHNAKHEHTEGLGIGLFLSRDILRRHGGDMWAESKGLGQGSTFFLKLPLHK